MTFRCSRSTEVLDLLERGHWPLACPAELRTHLDTCHSCTELLVVREAFRKSRAQTSASAQLPPPGVLWWRAQLRRRNAAVERVGRPILGGYLFALGTLVVVAVAVLIQQARHGFSWFEWLVPSQVASNFEFLNTSTLSSGWSLLILLAVFATIILISAVVVYVTTERQ